MIFKKQFMLGVVLTLGCEAAFACSIEGAQEQSLPGGKRISGQCSNNGSPVTCTYRDGEGWTCEGPGGSYNSLGNPEVAMDTTPKW